MALFKESYGDPYHVLTAYHREIKEKPFIKSSDASAFNRFSNFLMKCRRILPKSNCNQLGNPDVLCMLMAKLPSFFFRIDEIGRYP